MVFVPSPDTIRTIVDGTYLGVNTQWSLFWHDTTPPTEGHLQDIGQSVWQWWRDFLQGAFSITYTINRIIVTDESVQDGIRTDYVLDEGNAGERTDEALPNQCALVVTFLSGLRGRSHRGRIYHPGITIDNVTSGAIGTLLFTTVGDAFEALNTQMEGVSCEHVIVSRYSLGAPRTTAVKTTVSGYRVNPVVCTQRRRMYGVGA